MNPDGQIAVNFRGLDTDIFYEIDGGEVDWWFADLPMNATVTPNLLEEQRIIEACERDSKL
jgi:hypothetical protein